MVASVSCMLQAMACLRASSAEQPLYMLALWEPTNHGSALERSMRLMAAGSKRMITPTVGHANTYLFRLKMFH